AGPGLIAHVPSSAHSGNIMVLLGGGRYTSSFGPIYVFRHALHPPRPPRPVQSGPITGGASGTAFDGQGMWIWYVSRSNGGSVASIVDQARAAGVRVAVRLRRLAGGRGQPRRPRGGDRSRLPGDRRRGGVRAPLRGRTDLH